MSKKENLIVEKSFNDLYDLYKESIFSFCMAKLNCNVEGAEDCTQETFIVLFRKLKEGQKFENPRAFLYRTALNFIRRYLDKNKKMMQNEISTEENLDIADTENYVESEYFYKQLKKKLEEILNDEEKELFELRFYYDMKIEDIANQLGIKTTACATRISRMRTKIKEQIKDYL